MGIEGKVVIQARCRRNGSNAGAECRLDNCGLDRWQIELQRPQLAQQMLVGAGTEQALARVEQLFVVCRQSQRAAALQALGLEHDQRQTRQRLLLETIEQLLWRLSIDLPHALALGDGLEPFALIRRFISQQLAAKSLDSTGCTELVATLSGFFESLVGVSCEQFKHFDAERFDDWLANTQSLVPICLRRLAEVQIGTLQTRRADLIPLQLPEQHGPALMMRLAADGGDFCARPTLDGRAAETGPLAYMQHRALIEQLFERGCHELLLRYAARLLYLAGLIDTQTLNQPSGLIGSISLNGLRLGWAQSVRGLLLHLARVEQGQVVDYRICAPTEWNFHPHGPLARLLRQLQGNSVKPLKSGAELAALALDPCVPFEVNLEQPSHCYA